jgi:hypothetical protein
VGFLTSLRRLGEMGKVKMPKAHPSQQVGFAR